MVIQPKFRGFICTTAHPVGCAENVKQQIGYVKKQGKFNGPKNVLIIGASTGYGLASRITATFGAGSKTLGVFFERPATGGRTASAGWYNTAAFEKVALAEGYYAKSINGDAFSHEIKDQTIQTIKADMGKVDLVIYSLASPRRTDPDTKQIYTSVIKPIGKPFQGKTVDFHTGEISTAKVEPATEQEEIETVKVMGGEDWILWIKALKEANVLADQFVTLAYSYVGPKLTRPIYRDGTIGKAKDDLEASVDTINALVKDLNGQAYVAVNKALVTQSSSAIPVVPLYISLLFKVMKEKGIHEGCIEQIYRLFTERVYSGDLGLDEQGRIRVDDWEMREDVQAEVAKLWEQVTNDNIDLLADLAGFRNDFFALFGFGLPNVDYEAEVDQVVAIPSLEE